MGDNCLHVNTDIGQQCLLDRYHVNPHQYPGEEKPVTEDISAHDVIVQVLGNTFGTGGEYARDILNALESAGYAVDKPEENAERLAKKEREAVAEIERKLAELKEVARKPVSITEEALKDQPNIVQQIQSGRLNEYRTRPQGAAVVVDARTEWYILSDFAKLSLPVRMRVYADGLDEVTKRQWPNRVQEEGREPVVWDSVALRLLSKDYECEDAEAAGKEKAVEELARELCDVQENTPWTSLTPNMIDHRMNVARALIDAGWRKENGDE